MTRKTRPTILLSNIVQSLFKLILLPLSMPFSTLIVVLLWVTAPLSCQITVIDNEAKAQGVNAND